MTTNLEQQCITPGKWIIEGWNVRRFIDGSRWYAVAPSEAFTRPTLDEVRDEIVDRIEQRRA